MYWYFGYNLNMIMFVCHAHLLIFVRFWLYIWYFLTWSALNVWFAYYCFSIITEETLFVEIAFWFCEVGTVNVINNLYRKRNNNGRKNIYTYAKTRIDDHQIKVIMDYTLSRTQFLLSMASISSKLFPHRKTKFIPYS